MRKIINKKNTFICFLLFVISFAVGFSPIQSPIQSLQEANKINKTIIDKVSPETLTKKHRQISKNVQKQSFDTFKLSYSKIKETIQLFEDNNFPEKYDLQAIYNYAKNMNSKQDNLKTLQDVEKKIIKLLNSYYNASTTVNEQVITQTQEVSQLINSSLAFINNEIQKQFKKSGISKQRAQLKALLIQNKSDMNALRTNIINDWIGQTLFLTFISFLGFVGISRRKKVSQRIYKAIDGLKKKSPSKERISIPDIASIKASLEMAEEIIEELPKTPDLVFAEDAPPPLPQIHLEKEVPEQVDIVVENNFKDQIWDALDLSSENIQDMFLKRLSNLCQSQEINLTITPAITSYELSLNGMSKALEDLILATNNYLKITKQSGQFILDCQNHDKADSLEFILKVKGIKIDAESVFFVDEYQRSLSSELTAIEKLLSNNYASISIGNVYHQNNDLKEARISLLVKQSQGFALSEI